MKILYEYNFQEVARRHYLYFKIIDINFMPPDSVIGDIKRENIRKRSEDIGAELQITDDYIILSVLGNNNLKLYKENSFNKKTGLVILDSLSLNDLQNYLNKILIEIENKVSLVNKLSRVEKTINVIGE